MSKVILGLPVLTCSSPPFFLFKFKDGWADRTLVVQTCLKGLLIHGKGRNYIAKKLKIEENSNP